MNKNNQQDFGDWMGQQLVNISKAGVYDVLSDQVKELKEENKMMAEALKELVECDYTSGTHLSCAIIKGKEALKNRKPYNQ